MTEAMRTASVAARGTEYEASKAERSAFLRTSRTTRTQNYSPATALLLAFSCTLSGGDQANTRARTSSSRGLSNDRGV